MDFSEKISALAARSHHAAKHALTEEATKTGVVLPFIQALGFDVFNLEEVVPEFIADVGIKKGEKIDFAIRTGGKISILIEVKPISTSLGNTQYSQLFRYFSTTDARLAILINGREIWFFSDIDEPNKMDKKPFFVFDLQNYDESQVSDLARFEKEAFNVEQILEAASNLKYVKSAANLLARQLTEPDDDFVRLFARQMYEGSITKGVIEQIRPAVRQALDEVIRNRIQDKLNVTFGKDLQGTEVADRASKDEMPSDSVVTTDEEKLAYHIVQAIGSKITPAKRIFMRDAKSYCAVILDDNRNKTIARFYFNAKSVKYVGIFDAGKNEVRHQIEDVAEIYQFADEIEGAVAAHAPVKA